MFDAFKSRCCPTDVRERTGAQDHGTTTDPAAARAPPHDAADPPKLEDLIPLAVVIAAGCESCAESMVRRALEAGSLPRHVLRTVAIVADLRERECFRTKIAPEVVARMEAPLARARKTLDELGGAGGTSGARHSCA